jgi:signal transduction histidine kinase
MLMLAKCTEYVPEEVIRARYSNMSDEKSSRQKVATSAAELAGGSTMFQRDKWPFIPTCLSEIMDKDTLAVIESGCCDRLGRPLTILDYDLQTEGFSHRIESINEKQRYEGFCRFLRSEGSVNGGDGACKEWDIKQAKVSLQEFHRTGDPFRTFQCHMGLQDMTCIIRIRNRPVALVFSGQYRPAGGISGIQKTIQRLGTGSYSYIQSGDSERKQLLSLAQELRPMPSDARDRLEREARHIQSIAEAAFEQTKRQWEEEFLDELRTSIEPDKVADHNQLRQRLNRVLDLIRTFCNCQYVIFFGSTQEGDTVLAPLASAGVPPAIAESLPHYNWKKAPLPLESFDIRTQDLAKLYGEIGTQGIRGENSEYLAEAGCVIPVCLGDRYRGVLAFGPFEEPVDLQREQRFLCEITDIVGTFTLTALEVLYLGRERHRWRTAAQLLTHQFRTGLTPICNKIGRVKSLLSSDDLHSNMKRIRGFLDSAEDFAINLRQGAKETLASHVLQVEPDDLEFERYQLSVLVSNCATGYMGDARRNGRTLIVDPSIESLPQADVDVGRLTIALGNLIDNAIKYSYSNTEIIIRSHLDLLDTTVQSALTVAVIEVHDIGLPIRTKERELIFEQGTRGLTAAKMGRIPGSGLGLWEARATVEAHGATINVRCEPMSVYHGKRRAYHVVFSIRIPIEG